MLNSADIQVLYGKFIIGTLFFIRVLGITVLGPFFTSVAIPGQVKVVLAVMIAWIMTMTFWEQQPVVDVHLWNLALLGFKEFAVGAIIGFGANFIFYAARFAGGLIDFDMGFQTALMFDSGADSPTLIGEMKSLITLMFFLILNGHHYLIEALFASAVVVPIGVFEISRSTVNIFIQMTTSVLVIGLKMAAPTMAALFLTNLSLALLARIAPQTNVFVMSFQVKVAVGLLVLMSSVALLVFVLKLTMVPLQEDLMKLVLTLNPKKV